MDCLEAARLETKIGKNHCRWSAVLVGMLLTGTLYAQLPANTWTLLRQDPAGARRGSALRYAPKAGVFVLWGFMNDDPDLLQEQPLMRIPEYDVVAFDLAGKQWQSQFPFEWEAAWKKQLPLAYVPRTYSGITTGSERTVLRGPTADREGVPRPDLNIVFDQVAYHPPTDSLIYFTGGLTAAYHVQKRRWTDLRPSQSPPPVLAGSLAYDPLHDEIVLFGGGHVAEQGRDGRIVGYTGTWSYRFRENRWLPLALETQPPPRMNTRLVCDTKNQQLVLFGGDAQSHYLADTWIFDLKTRTWRPSKAASGPEARAGHFTVYDPETGWVIIGGGYNQKDLTDMWAFDASADRWMALRGEVPTGFYLSADLAPEKRVIVLAANTRKPGDTMSCNILYPVRSTYAYRIESKGILKPGSAGRAAPSQSPREKRLLSNRRMRLHAAVPFRNRPSKTCPSTSGFIWPIQEERHPLGPGGRRHSTQTAIRFSTGAAGIAATKAMTWTLTPFGITPGAGSAKSPNILSAFEPRRPAGRSNLCRRPLDRAWPQHLRLRSGEPQTDHGSDHPADYRLRSRGAAPFSGGPDLRLPVTGGCASEPTVLLCEVCDLDLRCRRG